jgi:hypothetical protein
MQEEVFPILLYPADISDIGYIGTYLRKLYVQVPALPFIWGAFTVFGS